MIAVALLALALWVPGLLYPPSDISHAIFRVAVCLAVAQGVALPQSRLARAGLALWAAGIAWSVVAAPDPWRAVWSSANRNEGAWQVSHYIVLVLVAAATPRERLVRWLAVAAALSAAWGLTPIGWIGGRLVGSTGNPLYLAPLALLGAWAAWRVGSWWRVLALTLVVAAPATGSAGVLVALVAAGGVLAFAKAPRLAFVGAVGLAALVWVAPMPASGAIRVELGRVALHGILARPLGWGAEGFPLVWDTFWRGVTPTGEAWHDRAHSLLLDRALEWGLVGLAGWLAVVVAAWRRAALLERMAITAYAAYSLTMFEMMWGAAAFACLLGYVLRGCPQIADRRVFRTAGWTAAALALAVGAAQLAQSQAASRAPNPAALEAAIDRWSPIGGDIIELYLSTPRPNIDWARARVETRSPHATQQAFQLAIWDRRYCGELRALAPSRPDVRVLCAPPQ